MTNRVATDRPRLLRAGSPRMPICRCGRGLPDGVTRCACGRKRPAETDDDHGYTSSATLALDGAEGVSAEAADVFAAEARDRHETRRREAVVPLIATLEHMATELDELRGSLTSQIAPPAARKRARRLAHDLRALADELPSDSPSDGGIQCS